MLFAFIIIGASFGYYKYTEYKKSIEVTVSSVDLIGKDHKYVEKYLRDAGFTSIRDDIIHDLEIENIRNEGVVTTVTIHGDVEFSATDRFPYDSPIKITYHMIQEIMVPLSSKEAKKLVCSDLEKKFKEAGFVDVRTDAEYDLITGWFTKDGSVESISINGDTKFGEEAQYRPDAPIVITYHTFSKNKGN